ncbi:MAG TPA: 4,5-DOPA dioxygenase extradiol [Acidimicrobiales bacterium]|nr:4,5-DOPA dioxygenase extradiol [Acidimicrobiales bacterium]
MTIGVNAESEPVVMPAAFLGHGSPMNALEHNRYTAAWRRFGASVPRPRAILVISAHWFINATAVTAMATPRVIHDFYGFPDELFAFDYPAPGAPEVAAEIVEAVHPHWIGLDQDSWGLDHGTWSVLAHAFPEADIPVVQLSINAVEPIEYHLGIGERLAPLCRRGVLVVGSGNIVHNLRRMDWKRPEEGFDWARRFDDEARAVVLDAPGDIARLAEHPDAELAVPTPDHFLPLVYMAGLAAAADTDSDVLVDGYAFGSLSMTSYTIGAVGESSHEAEGFSDKGVVPVVRDDLPPPDETNL